MLYKASVGCTLHTQDERGGAIGKKLAAADKLSRCDSQ